MKVASFYNSSGTQVSCELCKFGCSIAASGTGRCTVRVNQEGTLYSRSYDNVIALQEDPVEKKPLFHVAPGSIAFSYAAEGCNFTCAWCQNYQISQAGKQGEQVYGRGHAIPPGEIVKQAIQANAMVVAATYTEPTIFYELAYETAVLATEAGLINVWVTNGSIAPKPLEAISPFLKAANVDLKGMDNQKTKMWTGMSSQKVRETIELMRELGIWVELTTLLVPGFNDDVKSIERIARYIADLDPQIPWHITRYFPRYKYSEPPTPPTTLRFAQKIGAEMGLKFVYTGNLAQEGGEDTYCPGCGEPLIVRRGHAVLESHITSQSGCPHCDTKIPGIQMG